MERGEGERPSPGFRRPLGRPSSEIRRSKMWSQHPNRLLRGQSGLRMRRYRRVAGSVVRPNNAQNHLCESATREPRIRDFDPADPRLGGLSGPSEQYP